MSIAGCRAVAPSSSRKRPSACGRLALRFQVARRPHAGELARRRRVRAPGHSIEEKKIVGARAGLRGTAWPPCARRNEQKKKRAAGPIHRPHRMTFLRGPDLHSTPEARKGELFYCFNL